MSNIAIKAVNLGKVYKIRPDRGEVESRTLQEDIIDIFNPKKKRAKESLWALKDVSFEINDGEVVGLIGRNGAGKSTLLKILARITEPTTGYVDLYGRTGSLLEVGTGFHSELNGRENIYLGGAVLGMTKKEIDRKFDEIVDFSGVEKFLNTPVKRYSSGMKVRLAFSVAAHLEPEILLVDEVLSVGDAEFRKKSLGKMNDVAKGGRTVVFVSHNMGAVRNLCERTIWLDQGGIEQSGDTNEVIKNYLSQYQVHENREKISNRIRAIPPDPEFQLLNVVIKQDGIENTLLGNGSPIEISVTYKVLAPVSGLRIFFDLLDDMENIVIRSFHDENTPGIKSFEPGEYVSTVIIPADILAPRNYVIRINAGIHNLRNFLGEGIKILINVENTNEINQGYPQNIIRSIIQPRLLWNTSSLIE
ncbi:MAG: polysaccharide ABC transporter ATP-binding protein [Anaerolineae bacterium]|nr:polysaccharide ABC transporter ATP-binding protein [Anaerolineae bacterium]